MKFKAPCFKVKIKGQSQGQRAEARSQVKVKVKYLAQLCPVQQRATTSIIMITYLSVIHVISGCMQINHGDDYSESKYSVESVSGKYLENGWSNQHGDFSVEFVMEKLTPLFFCT